MCTSFVGEGGGGEEEVVEICVGKASTDDRHARTKFATKVRVDPLVAARYRCSQQRRSKFCQLLFCRAGLGVLDGSSLKPEVKDNSKTEFRLGKQERTCEMTFS